MNGFPRQGHTDRQKSQLICEPDLEVVIHTACQVKLAEKEKEYREEVVYEISRQDTDNYQLPVAGNDRILENSKLFIKERQDVTKKLHTWGKPSLHQTTV